VSDAPLPPIPSSAIAPGLLLVDRYRVDHLIAVGGMAEVWEGRDLLLERQVAVKILHRHLAADPSFVARFRTEAIAVARLHHPGIVAVYDTCSQEGVEAIVMELVHGHSLRQHLDDVGTLPVVDAIDIGTAVADALAVAHRAGLIHRDVKPANILLCEDDRVLITDFGIAKIVDTTDATATGTMLGSAKYLSPEQVEGRPVDARSDVFALGVVLYEGLAGEPPWLADSAAGTALSRLHTIPAPLREARPDVGPGLEAVVRKAMAIDPPARFDSATALRDALLVVRSGGTVAADLEELEAPPLLDRRAADPDATTIVPASHGPSPTTGAEPPSSSATPVAAPRSDEQTSVPYRGRSRWPAAVAVTVLVLAGLGAAAALLWDTDQGQTLLDDVTPTMPVEVAMIQATAFDPEGTGTPGENDAEAANVLDGDPATSWSTEGYDVRTFGTKRGVGIIITLDAVAPLDTVTGTSPTPDWAGEVYVADGSAPTLEGWGTPVASAQGIAGDHTFDVDGAEGSHVLLWITDLGAAPGRAKAQIDEIEVRAR